MTRFFGVIGVEAAVRSSEQPLLPPLNKNEMSFRMKRSGMRNLPLTL